MAGLEVGAGRPIQERAVFSFVHSDLVALAELVELVDGDPLIVQEERRVCERHDEEERKEEDEHRDEVSVQEAGERARFRLPPGLLCRIGPRVFCCPSLSRTHD